MSSFIKKVLVEQGELDRMQQRQLKDYSPELSALARLRTQMAETFSRKDLSDEQKLQLIYSYQSRFDKLQRDTGVLTSGPLMPPGPVVHVDQPANNVANKAVTEPKHKEATETDDDDYNKYERDINGNTLTPALKMVRDMRIEPMYQSKARNLLAKILDNPDVLKRNTKGELVVNGVAEPHTDFNSLFSSMVGRVHDLQQPGIDKFLGALRQIGVKSDELSGQQLQRLYSQRPDQVRASKRAPRPKPHQQDFVYSRTKKQPLEQQTGKGLKRKIVQPPGKQPKILFVY